ncbi:hypothetical protein [Halomonas citrativorans]|uniref:hypothetical protein n=1 Tax=Halomonas citrativorans TaxID=2742612 RepID=UPI000B360FE6|nr:hypothetical protein [Halomonas citrativorans]
MEIGAAVSAVKGALDLARAAKDVNDHAQLNAAMSDIMDKLTTAQGDLLDLVIDHYQLIKENRELKQRLSNKDLFSQYRLVQVAAGDYIMSLKDEYVSDEQPVHAICIKCKSEDRLSIMTEDEFSYQCPSCEHYVFQ